VELLDDPARAIREALAGERREIEGAGAAGVDTLGQRRGDAARYRAILPA